MLPGQPCVVQHASRERPAVRRHLRPKVVLTSVIGYKVSRYSVARARPEPLATAKVVSRLIPEQSVPSREYAALNYELSVPRRATSAIANRTAAPIGRLTPCLVKSSRKRPRYIRSGGEECLPNVNLPSLGIG